MISDDDESAMAMSDLPPLSQTSISSTAAAAPLDGGPFQSVADASSAAGVPPAVAAASDVSDMEDAGGAATDASELQAASDNDQDQGAGLDGDGVEAGDGIEEMFVERAFYFLERTMAPRRWCINAITWPWFERISMSVILLNCVTLGMYQPCQDVPCVAARCRVLETFDHAIFVFFAVEMCMKITAMGLIGRRTYLADTWNRLDFFIVVAGAVEYAVNAENLNLSAIRTVRVLRPIRAINRIPSMRILVTLLLDTLPMLGNVLMLCFFVFFIFGIIGVQLWSGLLRNRCFIELPENISTGSLHLPDYYNDSGHDFICSQPDDEGMTKCANLLSYAHDINGRVQCNLTARPFDDNSPTNNSCVDWNQYYRVCRPSDHNPFQGAISFDNIGLAWVAIFQVISLAGWVNIMYYVQDAHSFWDWIYFVALIIIGAFFMINLCLVVIATQFSETKKREMARMLAERKRFHQSSSSTLASSSEPGGCYDELIKYATHVARKTRRRLQRLARRVARNHRRRRVTPERAAVAVSLRRRRRRHRRRERAEKAAVVDAVMRERRSSVSAQQHQQTALVSAAADSRRSSSPFQSLNDRKVSMSSSSEAGRGSHRASCFTPPPCATAQHQQQQQQQETVTDQCPLSECSYYQQQNLPRRPDFLRMASRDSFGFASIVSVFSWSSLPTPPRTVYLQSPPVAGSGDAAGVRTDSMDSDAVAGSTGSGGTRYLVVPLELIGVAPPSRRASSVAPQDPCQPVAPCARSGRRPSVMRTGSLGGGGCTPPLQGNCLAVPGTAARPRGGINRAASFGGEAMGVRCHPPSPLVEPDRSKFMTQTSTSNAVTVPHHQTMMTTPLGMSEQVRLERFCRAVSVGNYHDLLPQQQPPASFFQNADRRITPPPPHDLSAPTSSAGNNPTTDDRLVAPVSAVRRNSVGRASSLSSATIPAKTYLAVPTEQVGGGRRPSISRARSLGSECSVDVVQLPPAAAVLPVDLRRPSCAIQPIDASLLASTFLSHHKPAQQQKSPSRISSPPTVSSKQTSSNCPGRPQRQPQNPQPTSRGGCAGIYQHDRYTKAFNSVSVGRASSLNSGACGRYAVDPAAARAARSRLYRSAVLANSQTRMSSTDSIFAHHQKHKHVHQQQQQEQTLYRVYGQQHHHNQQQQLQLQQQQQQEHAKHQEYQQQQQHHHQHQQQEKAQYQDYKQQQQNHQQQQQSKSYHHGVKFSGKGDGKPTNNNNINVQSRGSVTSATMATESCGGRPGVGGGGETQTSRTRFSDCEMNDDADGEDEDYSTSSSSSDSDFGAVDRRKRPPGLFGRLRNTVKEFIDSAHYQHAVLAAILVNTLSMGIEYHNQPQLLTSILEYSNLLFSFLFGVEMFLKIIADGLIGYIRDGFNVFDGFIVILSLVELLQGGTGGLSVLRTFRLLRILKLVRFLPALRYQLVVMLRTMDNVAMFFALLVLFIFIFSILGMNLFGCKFCDEVSHVPGNIRVCKRKNFDSLLWALITVFQILTQEDWHEVLYIGMAKTSPWAALYFIALMTFGNYVLFNLLVAILVEGFSSEAESEVRKKEEEREEEERRKTMKIKDINRMEEKEKELLLQIYSCKMVDVRGEAADIKNNKEKEKLLFGLPPSVAIIKDVDQTVHRSSVVSFSGSSTAAGGGLAAPLPPQITHTAATPMGSPSPGDLKQTAGSSLRPQVTATPPSRLAPQGNGQAQAPRKTDSPPPFVTSSTTLAVNDVTIPPPPPAGQTFHAPPPQPQPSAAASLHAPPGPTPPPAGQGSPSAVRRRDSRRSQCGWSRGRLSTVEDSRALVDSRSEEDSEPEGPRSALLASSKNLSVAANNAVDSTSKSPCSDTGGLVPLNNQRDSSSRQNSVCSYRSLSPQNSFSYYATGSAAAARVPASRQSSVASSRFSGPGAGTWTFRDSRQNSVSCPPATAASPRQNCRSVRAQPSIGSASLDEYQHNDLVGSAGGPSGPCGAPGGESGGEQTADSATGGGQAEKNWVRAMKKNGEDGCSCGAEETRRNGAGGGFIRRFLRAYFPKPRGCFQTRKNYALYIFHPSNRLRVVCHTLATTKNFDFTILLCISLNCITLAMERPDIPVDSAERHFLNVSNYAFSLIFFVEMAVKVIAKGMFVDKHAYLRSGWNIMDGGLVAVSLVDIAISWTTAHGQRNSFGILRVFRLLRTLRPLRVISRAPGLKLVVQTLLSSLRPIGNIVLICCTFFIIFGILGVQLFKGTFYHCEGPDVADIVNKTDCLNKGPPYRWVNCKYNFDNLGQALMALFVLASKDGWVNIMYTGLDAVGIDQQPRTNHNEWCLVYFISFLLLVGFFVLNMFVGVVVENFHKCRESQEQEEKARRDARHAKKLEHKRKKLLEPPYWSHYSKPRLWLHTVIGSKYFDVAISCVIGINVVTMAIEHYQMPKELHFALKIFNFLFTSVFILESVAKVVALGFIRYIRDRWNQLDVAIVILSIVGIVLEEIKSGFIPINPTIIRVMRVMRIARVLKLLKLARSVRALLDTVMQALPEVGNLGLLFFLLFYIFAALGVELFGRVECSAKHPCEGLDKHAHFRNFGMAFLTLFRVATGDNWNGIMKDTLRDDCDASEDCVRNCCVSRIIAPVFFVVFVLMAQFVLVNVVVAVLMKHLEESHKHLDEYADMEAEILREMEEEDAQRSKKQQLKQQQQQFTPKDGCRLSIIDGLKSTVGSTLGPLGGQQQNDANTHQVAPMSFAFNVLPPSPDCSPSRETNPGISSGRREFLQLPVIRTESRVFLPGRPDMDDMECFQICRGSNGVPSRREADWERRDSSVSDSVAFEAMSGGVHPAGAAPLPGWMTCRGRRSPLSRQDAVSSSSNSDSTPRLLSPAADGYCSPPWALSPVHGTSPAVSPLWTGSGLPPPPSWTSSRSPGWHSAAAYRTGTIVQRSASSVSAKAKQEEDREPPEGGPGWSIRFPPTRQTANSQPSVSTQRPPTIRPRPQNVLRARAGDWAHLSHHKSALRPQLSGPFDPEEIRMFDPYPATDRNLRHSKDTLHRHPTVTQTDSDPSRLPQPQRSTGSDPIRSMSGSNFSAAAAAVGGVPKPPQQFASTDSASTMDDIAHSFPSLCGSLPQIGVATGNGIPPVDATARTSTPPSGLSRPDDVEILIAVPNVCVSVAAPPPCIVTCLLSDSIDSSPPLTTPPPAQFPALPLTLPPAQVPSTLSPEKNLIDVATTGAVGIVLRDSLDVTPLVDAGSENASTSGTTDADGPGGDGGGAAATIRRRRSVSIGRTGRSFCKSFDEGDTQNVALDARTRAAGDDLLHE